MILKDMKKELYLLDYIKPLLTDKYEFYLDNPEDSNWIMAYENHILDEYFETFELRNNTYNSITSERIKELSQMIFTCDNLVLFIKSMKHNIDLNKIKDILKELDN
jgi:hypothetical protein